MSSNSSNPCADAGFDYDCNTPTPRSAFTPDQGPLCSTVSQFLYDPANCDPGYWCGCSTTIPDDCLPVNGENTNWIGHYTTVSKTTGETIVLEGLIPSINAAFDINVNLTCREGFYCPGMNDTERCVDLCPPESVCASPGEKLKCPKGKYCPIATTDPLDCEGLQTCEEGVRRFTYSNYIGLFNLINVIAVVHLFFLRWRINKRARKDKAEKLALKKKMEHTSANALETSSDDDDKSHKEDDAGVAEERGRVSYTPREVTGPEMKIDIEFEELSLTIPNVGTIMRGVSGELNHGEVTAVMGPSGAGKTTFLTLMSGKLDRSGGSLKVNGEETELTQYRKIIGYVPQEDVMLRDLTVEENIRHSALMRLPANMPMGEKLKLVDETLELLEIDHVRDTVVGDENKRGISGGQRKRVNIALEMVTQPSLLCLDEPTSGLDSTTSLTVLQSLKDMAASGVNVVSVLHQPKYEIFNLFDKVLLLGKGGRTVYYGERASMVSYFEKRGFPLPEMTNPADFYMDVLSGEVPHATDPDFRKEDLFEMWMCAPENPHSVSEEEAKAFTQNLEARMNEEKEYMKKNCFARFFANISTHISELCAHLCRDFGNGMSGRNTPGTFAQFCLLFKRTYLQRIRTPWSSLITIVLMGFAGSLIANLVPTDTLLYNGIPESLVNTTDPFWDAYLVQNVQPVDQIPGILGSVYFFLLIVSCLSVNVFGRERAVFFRETATGQSVVSYWAAKSLEVFLWIPVYGWAFVLLGYDNEAWFLQPLRQYWTFFFLTLTGYFGFGFISSILFGSSAALVALVFGIITNIFFSGTITEPPTGISNAFFIFWATQGLSVNEYDIYSYGFDVDRLNANTDDNGSSDLGGGQVSVGAGVGKDFDMESSFARNAGLCAATAFAWHVLVLWTLKTRHHKKQR